MIRCQEVEREISFRTEQGLYYSYFKQLVRAPSLAEGLDQLRADNMTESGHAINILERCGAADTSAEIHGNVAHVAGSTCTRRWCWPPSISSTTSGSPRSCSTCTPCSACR